MNLLPTLPNVSSTVYFFSSNSILDLPLLNGLKSRYGHVTIFNDIAKFESAILKTIPDVALLDIDSPEGRTIKLKLAEREIKTFPVIYLSNFDNFKDRLQAVHESAEGYFLFPVNIEQLCNRIDESISKIDIRSYRVLVVDDDDFFLNFADAVLSSDGMIVQTLQDPSSIIETINRFKPEIIVTDLYMPQCTGLDMAKIIRQNSNYIDIPIVFISTENAIQEHINALELGADDFLTKPIDHEALIAFISAKAERFRSLRNR